MNMTDLINRELEPCFKKYGKDDDTIKTYSKIMKIFGYEVLKEINRLNFTAFTVIDDDDLTKQGFGNMLLNYLVDKDDEVYGKIKFTEYKAWKKVNEITPNIHDKLVIVKRSNDKLDFATFTEFEKWINQDNEELSDVVEWRSLYSITDL